MFRALKKYSNITFLPNYELRNAIAACSSEVSGVVLDIGCGAKPYEDLFKCDAYIGLDTKNSGHNHHSSKVDVYYDGHKIPFPDEYFDGIVAFQVLEHVEDIESMFSEIRRVLKKSGKLLITAPLIWPEHEVPYDFCRWTSFGISNLLEKNFFEIMQQDKVGSTHSVIAALFLNSFGGKANPISKILIRLLSLAVNALVLAISHLAVSSSKSREMYFDNIVLVRK